MAGWHHWLDGRESEWTPGVGDGQPGMLQFMGSQIVGHNWATGLIWRCFSRLLWCSSLTFHCLSSPSLICRIELTLGIIINKLASAPETTQSHTHLKTQKYDGYSRVWGKWRKKGGYLFYFKFLYFPPILSHGYSSLPYDIFMYQSPLSEKKKLEKII